MHLKINKRPKTNANLRYSPPSLGTAERHGPVRGRCTCCCPGRACTSYRQS